MIYIISTVVYILSFAIVYFWVRNAFSAKGKFESMTPDSVDLFLCIFPVINTLAAIVIIFQSPYKNPRNNFSSFFRIK